MEASKIKVHVQPCYELIINPATEAHFNRSIGS